MRNQRNIWQTSRSLEERARCTIPLFSDAAIFDGWGPRLR